MEEKFLPIPNYPGYMISNNGYVISYRQSMNGMRLTLSSVSKTDLHQKVKLSNENGTKSFFIHRLVMMIFNPVDNMQALEVNHLDGNPLNNCITNLQWVTSKENHEHYKNILIPERKLSGTFQVGRKGNFYKVEFINGIINYYQGQSQIAADLGVSAQTVFRWTKGQLSPYIKSFNEVENIPNDWVNTSYKVPHQRNQVIIEYWKKEDEIYDNCAEADRSLGLTKGTILRWSKRDWSSVSSGKVTDLGIKYIYIHK